MTAAGEDRIRLVFAIDNLRHGGAQKILRAVLARIDPERARAVIWRLGGAGEIEKWYTDMGVEVVAYPAWQMRSGVGLARMYRRLRRLRPALVQTFLFHADICGRVLGRLAGVPVVVSSARATNVCKSWWQFWLDRLTARLADRVIAVSQATRDFAIAHEGVDPGRAVVIPNGIDVESWSPGRDRAEARAELGYRDGDFVVGTIGRLHEQKGHEFLIEAAAQLRSSHPAVRVFIAGYGPLEGRLRRRIEQSGLADSVRFLGYRTDVARLLAAMDLFVLPSLWEGMPNALLEAMAMALPSVTTAVDGNLDLVVNNETGILVGDRDASALAWAIGALAEDPRRCAAMGAAARARVARHFSLDRTTDAYLDLYEDLLSARTGRPVEEVRLRKPPHA